MGNTPSERILPLCAGHYRLFFLFNSPCLIQFAFGDMHNCISSLTTGFCQFFSLDLLFQFEQGLVCLAVQCGLTRTDILMFIVLMIWSSPCRRQCTKSNIMTCAPVQKKGRGVSSSLWKYFCFSEKLRHCEKAFCFDIYSVTLKQVGDFFKKALPFQKTWTLVIRKETWKIRF